MSNKNVTVSVRTVAWRLIAAAVIGLLVATAPSVQAQLSIHATSAVNPARASELLDIQITVTNGSAFSRSGVSIEMIYPAGLLQLFESEFDGDCASTTWTLGSIPAGGAVTVVLPAFVTNVATTGTIISFAPTVTDSLLDSDSTTLDIEVQTDTLYDLALAENSDPATAGALLTYTLTYGYRADAAAVTNSTLRFPIPAGTTFVAATGGGTLAGGSVDWPLGPLSQNDGGARAVTVQLGGGLAAADVVIASAEIFAVATPSENLVAQASTVIASARGLQMTVEANPGPARPSELVNYQIGVTNTDPFTRFGVVLRGIYPQGVSQLFESEFDGDCTSTSCTQGERVTWTLGDIPAGGSVTVDLAPDVSNVTIGGVLLPVSLIATDSAGLQARRTGAVRVQSDSVYDLALAERSDPARAGATLQYTLSFGYREDAGAVSNSVLRLPVPAGTTFVAASDGGALNSGNIEWPLGFLSPGDSGERQATVLLDAGLAAADVIEAAAEVGSVTDLQQSARAEAMTVIAADDDLQLTIESNTSPADNNFEAMNLQLTVTNTSAFTRFGVQAQMRFPDDVAQLIESEFDGQCSSTSCTSGELVTFTLGDIPAGGSVSTSLAPIVSNVATAGELINFFAWASDDQGAQTRQLDAIRVDSSAIYDLALAEDSDPALAGSELGYTLTWGYLAGAGAVNQSRLRLPLPAGPSFVSASHGGALNGVAVEWPLGFLSPGDSGVRRAVLAVDGGLASGTMIEAAATVGSVSSPLESARAEATTAITASDPLQLAIERLPDAVRTFELSNFRLKVTNNDPFERFGVMLTTQYPQEFGQAFESEFEGNCSSTSCTGAERLTWTLGNIPAGGSRTVELPATVGSGTNYVDGALINLYATARDDQGVQTRQVESLRIQNDTVYDLALFASDPVTPGASLTYRLTYGYRQDAAAVSETQLELHLPADVTVQSISGGGVLNGRVITWSPGFLSPGDGGVQQVTVTVDGGLASGTVLEAYGEVFSVSTPDQGMRGDASTVVQTSVPLTLNVEPRVFTGVANRRLRTLITITNNDAFTRFGVRLRGRFPQDVNSLSESDPNFDGDCSSTSCTAGERVTWPTVDIPAGDSVTVIFPPVVASPTVDGRLINFLAWVDDDQGAQARGGASVVTGCVIGLDNDCDGILDSEDNCLGTANTDQRDTDGDNIGNRCDPDIAVPNDCQINPLDLGTFKVAFFSTPGDAAWNPDADLDGDNAVNSVDLGILRSFFFQAPGPSALANACSP